MFWMRSNGRQRTRHVKIWGNSFYAEEAARGENLGSDKSLPAFTDSFKADVAET